MKKRTLRLISIILVVLSIAAVFCVSYVASAKDTVTYIKNTPEVQELMSQATQFVLVRHKQLGASHYAYTEAVSDERSEYSFHPGSKLCLVTLEVDSNDSTKVKVTEKELIKSASGVLRDPDVSEDGTRVVYSYKENDNDDFHLYELDLTTNKKKQLTFGSGVADIEPVYASNGTIIFSSTRDVQTVDCWYTPVSNIYMCNADGSNITRLGYDQVHTTFPTSTTDGRILYTRWDYNDRNQMYVQALFQMFPDGTLQTEVFGNGANNPTTLLHTREIPGSSYKYVTIISGHHMNQVGKIAVVDTSKGRNDRAAVDYIAEDSATRQLAGGASSIDSSLFQEGTVYKYPYAFSDDMFLVSMSKSYSGGDRSSAFDIVLMDEKGKYQTIVENVKDYPASQMVPIQTEELHNRSSMVDYSKETGTYYMANVYLGEGMEGVKEGTAKYLRVVALDFRPYSIGATNAYGTGSADPYSPIATGNGSWDVKQVLGIVPIEADGSALFTVPSETPVYFQVLDENGDLIQTMRSWSTLQPGESFSCIGCHVDKNTAPQTSLAVTDAMRKGVQELQPDIWMGNYEEYEGFDPYEDEYIGFDYLSVVQPILDASCVTCHSNTETAFNRVKIDNFKNSKTEREKAETIFTADTEWEYTKVAPGNDWFTAEFDSSSWSKDTAPFGQVTAKPGDVNTIWKDTDTLWLRKTQNITQYDVEAATFQLSLAHSGTVTIYVNGTEVYTSSDAKTTYTVVTLSEAFRSALNVGENVIAVKVTGSGDNRFFGLALKGIPSSGEGTIIGTETFVNKGAEWTYVASANDDYSGNLDWTKAEFDASAWKSQAAPFGNRLSNGEQKSDWSADVPYLWARYEFNIDDVSKYKNAVIEMDAFYDDDIYVYINGQLVYSHDEWNNGYTKYTLDGAAKHLVNGKNVIAVSLHQHTGGYEWDAAFVVNIMDGTVLSSDAPVSFENIPINGDRMQKYFPLSYLVLTGSAPQGDYEWIGNSSNRYTTYISSMSQCEVLNPYAGGATKSSIITKLRKGHGNLTEEQIAAIACWIDLCVPCYGSYSPEGNTIWDNDNERSAVEKENKRHIYEVLDEYAKLDRAGKLSGEVKIVYKSQTATGDGYAVLYTERNLQMGSVLKVTLPEGKKYLGLSLSARVGEAIIYCPTGEFEFKIPTTFSKVMPGTFTSYITSAIVARVVSDEELTKVHNLALNPYDYTTVENAYPHVETSTTSSVDIITAGRNVIDGFVANQQKGSYPSQAWEPGTLTANDYITINYGREVTIEELVILMRCAATDTHFTSCTVEFSDGTTMELSLKNSKHEQRFDIDPVTTTYVKFTNFVVAEENRSVAITEIQTMGVENLK